MKLKICVLGILALSSCKGSAVGNNDAGKNETVASQAATDPLEEKITELKRGSADRSTPDKAIESFIVGRNLAFEFGCYVADRAKAEGRSPVAKSADSVRDYYLTFFAGKALNKKKPDPDKNLQECLKGVTKFSLDIKDVKEETPTRAIVVANIRNISAIPDGATPDDFDKKHRAEGVTYKYQLTKDQGQWKIAQVYEFDEYLKHDWVPQYKDDDGPAVPWYVSAD